MWCSIVPPPPNPVFFWGDQCRRMGAATRKTLGRLLRRGRTIRAPAPGVRPRGSVSV